MLRTQLNDLMKSNTRGRERGKEDYRLESGGDWLVVSFVNSELLLKNWQFTNQGRGKAKGILNCVEEAVQTGNLAGAKVTDVVNYRFANHLHRRGWCKVDHGFGCAPDYELRGRN